MKISLALWKNDGKKDGKYPIKMRINYKENGRYKRKVLKTGFSVEPEFWSKENTLLPSHPRYFEIMSQIKEQEKKVKEQLKLNNNSINAVKSYDEYEKNRLLVTFIDKHIQRLKIKGNHGTARKYLTLKNHLISYEEKKNVKLTVNDINIGFLEELEDYFINETNCNTVNGYKGNFEKLSVIFKDALRKGYISHNTIDPFTLFKLPKKNSSKNKELPKNEFYSFFIKDIARIKEKTHPLKFLSFIRAKNMFLFQFFAHGMRGGDMLRLKWGNLVDNNIHYTVQKTDKNHSVYLYDEIVQILRLFLPKPFKHLYYLSCQDEQFLVENSVQFIKECSTLTKDQVYKELLDYGLSSKPAGILVDINIRQTKETDFDEQISLIRSIFPVLNKKDHIFLTDHMNNRLKGNLNESQIYSIFEYELAKYNRQLKIVQENLGINANLTSHIARHTYTSQMLDVTDDVYAISRSLAHQNIQVTENYLKTLDNQRVNKANDKLVQRLRKGKFSFYTGDDR